MCQLPEEPPVAAVVYSAARIVAAGHARESGKGAGIPDADAFDLIRSCLVIGDREAGAG